MNNGKAVRAAMLAVLLAAAPADAAQQRMELVWSQSDGLRQEIYASSSKDGTWSDPVKITNGDANKLHPVLEIAPDGTEWAFWSAVTRDGIAIEYATGKDGVWSEAQQMELHQSSAITPSVLIEDSATVWLVWAGNDGGQDEIYYSRYLNAAWEEAKTVHPTNEVPDIKPEISRTSQGQIEAQWIGVRNGRYKQLFSTYSAAAGWSAEQERVSDESASTEEAQREEKVKALLPDFLPQDSQYSLKVL